VVLVPGEADWVEKRTREILEAQEDGSEHHFMVIPGQERYQAVVEKDYQDVGSEMVLGRALSYECDEPVYAIEGIEEFPFVTRFLKGEESSEEQEPEDLVRALGCVMPWEKEPQGRPLKRKARTVALIQGLSMAKVRNALDEEAGRPLPPGYYHIEETPIGVLLTDGTGILTVADNYLAERFPLATVYAVTATPSLDLFNVMVTRNRKTVQFAPRSGKTAFFPPIDEVMGERTPERILAALGIPKEWFRL
jgi:hypothetical protein